MYKQALKRLLKNNIIPQINDKIKDLKLPQIINLMSKGLHTHQKEYSKAI